MESQQGSERTSMTLDASGSEEGKKRSPEDRRMAQLGYEEVLKRDYDAFSLFCLVVANLGVSTFPPILQLELTHSLSGFLQGGLYGALGAQSLGGGSMLTIAWPLTAIAFSAMSAILAELASAYPHAGAMMTWTFRLCREIPALRPYARFATWFVGSFLLCAHGTF